MWVRGAAIRPVPRYAVVDARTLEKIERELADDSGGARDALADQRQPLAAFVTRPAQPLQEPGTGQLYWPGRPSN